MSKRNRSKSSAAKNKPLLVNFPEGPIVFDEKRFQESLKKHKAGSRKEQRR